MQLEKQVVIDEPKQRDQSRQLGDRVPRSTQPAPTTKPRLLFFYAPSDGAARRCEGYLAQVLQQRRNHQTFLIHHIDISQHAALAKRFRITDTPAIVVIAEGKIRTRITKPKGCAPIREQLEPWLR